MESGSVNNSESEVTQGSGNILLIDISNSDGNYSDPISSPHSGLNNNETNEINLNVIGKHKLKQESITCSPDKKAKIDQQSNLVILSRPTLIDATNVHTKQSKKCLDFVGCGEPTIGTNSQNYEEVLQMFPEINKDYLTDLFNDISDLNEIITTILDIDGGYPKQKKHSKGSYKRNHHPSQTCVPDKPDTKLEFLTTIFPDADPLFLETISGQSENNMKKLIDEALDKNDYPKKDDISLYTATSFNFETFLKIFPDPFSYFLDSNRKCQFSAHSFEFLKRKLRKHSVKEIHTIYKKEHFNLAKAYKNLKNIPNTRCTRRSLDLVRMPEEINLPFLQEACFIEHEDDIIAYLDSKAEEKRVLELAKKKEELVECGCCYAELLIEDCATCNEGDLFCKSCIIQNAKVRIGDGLNSFPCLLDCGADFSLNLLQNLLDPNVFSQLLKRIQLEEIRAADIEGLEVCPFCEFATIPHPADTTFYCLNEDCHKESCRKCHKVNHFPENCEEVEGNDQVKARKYIEDEMTKALIRECLRCKKKFIKADGCNKMTCTCGSMMCYICRKPIVDYTHFNGPGGDAIKKCPLYSSDKLLHEEAVKAIAVKALETVTTANPDLKLVHDPTKLLPNSKETNQLPDGMEEDIEFVLERLQAP